MDQSNTEGLSMPNDKNKNTKQLEELPKAEKLQALSKFIGAWADQPDLDQIFKEIESERGLGARKDVKFED